MFLLLSKISKELVQKQCFEIRNYMADGKNDHEIIQLMGINTRSFYRRKAKIFKEDKEIWDQVIFESLEHRALEVKKALEFCVKTNKEIASDTNQPARDRIEATKTLSEANIALWHLIVDGPSKTQERQVQRLVSKQLSENPKVTVHKVVPAGEVEDAKKLESGQYIK